MVTCLNLLSGCVATVFALQGDAFTATIFIMAGAVFDFFDGFLARLLDAHSIIGKDRDSLAVTSQNLAPHTFLTQPS